MEPNLEPFTESIRDALRQLRVALDEDNNSAWGGDFAGISFTNDVALEAEDAAIAEILETNKTKTKSKTKPKPKPELNDDGVMLARESSDLEEARRHDDRVMRAAWLARERPTAVMEGSRWHR